MTGQFVMAKDAAVEAQDFGTTCQLCNPSLTGARQLTVIDVSFAPGKGHSFHRHPRQEEVLHVIAGKVEQWVDGDKRVLGPGDSAFIPPDIVHASFNTGDQPARILAMLGPCVGASGYEVVDVSHEAPWNTLRK